MILDNTDIIVVSQHTIDFPIFREFLHRHKSRLSSAIYVFPENNLDDYEYTEFIKNDLDFCKFVNSEEIKREDGGITDWRDAATNRALEVSTADSVLFIEPDFIISDENLFKIPDNEDIVGYFDETLRIWPSFLYVKKYLIHKTHRNFSAGKHKHIFSLCGDYEHFEGNYEFKKYEEVDHFGKFVSDLIYHHGNFFYLNENGILFDHMRGTTHNWNLFLNNTFEHLFSLEKYKEFIRKNLNANVNMHLEYKKQAIKILEYND